MDYQRPIHHLHNIDKANFGVEEALAGQSSQDMNILIYSSLGMTFLLNENWHWVTCLDVKVVLIMNSFAFFAVLYCWFREFSSSQCELIIKVYFARLRLPINFIWQLNGMGMLLGKELHMLHSTVMSFIIFHWWGQTSKSCQATPTKASPMYAFTLHPPIYRQQFRTNHKR
jgi:hypothetical protein